MRIWPPPCTPMPSRSTRTRRAASCIPAELVSHAGLSNQVSFMGMGETFQIWEPEAGGRRRAEARNGARLRDLTYQGRPRHDPHPCHAPRGAGGIGRPRWRRPIWMRPSAAAAMPAPSCGRRPARCGRSTAIRMRSPAGRPWRRNFPVRLHLLHGSFDDHAGPAGRARRHPARRRGHGSRPVFLPDRRSRSRLLLSWRWAAGHADGPVRRHRGRFGGDAARGGVGRHAVPARRGAAVAPDRPRHRARPRRGTDHDHRVSWLPSSAAWSRKMPPASIRPPARSRRCASG